MRITIEFFRLNRTAVGENAQQRALVRLACGSRSIGFSLLDRNSYVVNTKSSGHNHFFSKFLKRLAIDGSSSNA